LQFLLQLTVATKWVSGLAQPPARRAIAQSAGWVNEANLTSAEANQVMLFLQVSLAAIHGFPGP